MGEARVEPNVRHCPVCGAEFCEGKLYAMGKSLEYSHFCLGAVAGSLWWEANEKIPCERPLRLLGKQKAVKVCLLGDPEYLHDEECPKEVPGWYCPSCKKVFAWFDAPGVPLELCDGETANPEGGAR